MYGEIKRGKRGAKKGEFGSKVSLSHLDGFTFVEESCLGA